MNNPAGWFEIYVQDMARARAFYETVFDVQLTRLDGTEFEMWGFPMQQSSYGASGALIRLPGFASGANSVIVYFSCDDCAVEAGRVVEAGGKIETGKKAIGQYGFIALAFDTEGNLFGLHSMQ
jgi:predicted enzyme related to lactoylglutathione lyase